MWNTHRQQYKQWTSAHKHNNLIKEFTPLWATSPRPAPNGSLLLNCPKFSKTCLTMLKMTNWLLQWLHSVPKPLSGLFQHLNRLKNEEDSLLEVFPFNFVVSGSTNRTLVLQTWLTRSFKCKNLVPGATAPTVQTVGRLRRLQPLTASALGHVAHATLGSAKKWLNRLKPCNQL